MTRKENMRLVGQVYLTEREVEALTLLAKGMTNEQIGNEMGCSGSTGCSYIKIIFRKIGANNRAVAGVIAAKAGLV